VIAQCLSAAQRTVPSHFTVHSMHCYFVLAGDAEIPILYHVEHVREGKSFATRTVQARQRGKAIFTVTMSFVREGSGGKKLVTHEAAMPDVPGPRTAGEGGADGDGDGEGGGGPFESQRIEILNSSSRPIPSRPSSITFRPNVVRAAGRTGADRSGCPTRQLTPPTRQKDAPMDQSARPHLAGRRLPGAPLGAGLHVGQLLHRHRVAGAQPVALRSGPAPRQGGRHRRLQRRDGGGGGARERGVDALGGRGAAAHRHDG